MHWSGKNQIGMTKRKIMWFCKNEKWAKGGEKGCFLWLIWVLIIIIKVCFCITLFRPSKVRSLFDRAQFGHRCDHFAGHLRVGIAHPLVERGGRRDGERRGAGGGNAQSTEDNAQRAGIHPEGIELAEMVRHLPYHYHSKQSLEKEEKQKGKFEIVRITNELIHTIKYALWHWLTIIIYI